MAPKKDPTALSPDAFLKAVEAGRISGLYLLEGEEENLKSRALSILRKAVLQGGMEELNEVTMENPPVSELIAACETLPFLSDRRLVIVREQDGLSSRADCDPKLIDYLPSLPSSTVLVFYHRGSVNKTRSLPKKIKSCGSIVTFNRMENRDLGSWVQQAFSDLGKKCSLATASRLVFTSGNDTGILQTEIHKIASFADDRELITDADIESVATRSTECRVFAMIDALVSQQNAKALRMMQDMLMNGETRAGILAMLLRQFRLMQHLKIMQFEKVPPQELAKAMKLSDYQLDQLQRQARNYTGGQIRRGVDICLSTEYRFKSGQINEEGSLESALLQIIALKNAAS